MGRTAGAGGGDAPRPQGDPTPILALLAERFAKWQLPDDILFVDEFPHTATGKISKLVLREQLAETGYALAGVTRPRRRLERAAAGGPARRDAAAPHDGD